MLNITEGKITIPTYPEAAAEELPMFAENRVHQRTSGRPYPNKVVMRAQRGEKINKEYTVVTLENEYVKIEILPEIGGRIYSALDKTTGYDFFYKQHVIKPALIGVLGSWISGGVEFNWPFHHRASGFMPCDYSIERMSDGAVACHLSEHDPIDRMKGMVSIILKENESFFETRMSLYNRTDCEKSFLWWENAAVPVNEDYRIFFPQDVSYVNFHYLKSRITYPIAGDNVFNGIPMEEDRDISWHKNTRQATSYFACASEYDFFGGYDYGKKCGVVHIGDHHISPGKKMFTWAYCQLAKSWENALTDTDGQYAELMAGSYSDNQPNFSWLAPYETKEFSQFWYPIKEIGTPVFANINCAFGWEDGKFTLQSTKCFEDAEIIISGKEKVYLKEKFSLSPDKIFSTDIEKGNEPLTVAVKANGREIAFYAEKEYDKYKMPEVISDMPEAKAMESADELYLAGVHVSQYRDPAVMPDSYWTEALKRNPKHIPSLIGMAKYELGRYSLESALSYAEKAIAALTIFNTRTESGEAYYTMGRILEAAGKIDRAYDFYYKAFWSADSAAKAMTRIAVIDIKRKNYEEAKLHAEKFLDYGRKNNLAWVCLVIAKDALGEDIKNIAKERIRRDSGDFLMRFLNGENIFGLLHSDPVQTCLDIAFDLSAMGQYERILKLLSGLEENRSDCRTKPLYYTLAYFKNLAGEDGKPYIEKAKSAELGACYPMRREEIAVLEYAENYDKYAKMLLGCLLYNKRRYSDAAEIWEEVGENYIAKRNLAVAYFSHLNKKGDALEIMKSLLNDRPYDEELLYETVVLMDKMNIDPIEKINLIKSHRASRDDVLTELAKAYNQAFDADMAIETLLGHEFIPCEGGEHAIADQYMFAYLVKGREELNAGNEKKALEFFGKGQELPQSLGAGIWNHCKLIPLKYHEALCLEALGEKAEADKIFEYIAGVKIEYFSNMHLKELPYWQAKSLIHLGKKTAAQNLITKYLREWDRIKDVTDNGFFGTTPFFISFIDDPKILRSAQYLYLTALCESMRNSKKAAAMIKESAKLNNDNMFALFIDKYGFSEYNYN